MVISVSQIPNLPVTVALNGTEQFEIVQNGTSQRVSLSLIGTYLGSTNLGTVSSVGASGGSTGFSFTGTPITTTGTLVLTGTLNPTSGGTGLTSVTAHALMLGNGTSAFTVLAPGVDGQVLTAHTGGAPTWTTAAVGSVTSVAASGGTTGLSFTGSPITTSGTLTLTGTLNVANGGTGAATLASHGMLYGNGTSAVGVVAAGTDTQVLTAHTGGPPTWETPTSGGTVTSVAVASANGLAGSVATPTTTAIITLSTDQLGVLYGDGTALIGIDGATGEVLIGNTGAAPTWLAGGTDDQVLTSHAGASPTWEDPASGGLTIGTTTITNGTSGRVLYDNAGVLDEMTTTGTGTQLVLATGPTINNATIGGTSTFTSALGSIAASTPALNATQTWNNVAVNFSALNISVTDTAHADPSFLIRLRLGGLDKFFVDAFGNASVSGGVFALGSQFAQQGTAVPAGGIQDVGYLFSSTAHFGAFFGSGAPTLSAAQGSIYLRSDGVPYYNTNGTTGWSTIGLGFTLGTGVATALAVNVGTAGAFVVNGGALGTPSSGTATNLTGLPIGGITGLGTGVGTALAVNVGSAGAFVTFNGALGTPSSGTATNLTGLPIAGITGLGTGVGTALAINVGSAGAFVTFNGALGTPSSGTATNLTGLPIAGITGLGTGVGTWLGTPSSANLKSAMTDETGTGGALVFATAPAVTQINSDVFLVTSSNVVNDSSTSRSLTNADNGITLVFSNTGAITLTVPTSLTAGFGCMVVTTGSGGVVTVTASGTTLRARNGLKTAGQYAALFIAYLATDTYVVGGDTST